MLGRHLRREIGWRWPLFLLSCQRRSNSLLANTSWANADGPEAEFVKRLAIAPMIYAGLQELLGPRHAYEALWEVLVEIGTMEQWDHMASLRIDQLPPMQALDAFNQLMDRRGMARFNTRRSVEKNDLVCRFEITRCIILDFLSEAGAPELTKAFCEVDRRFFPQAFPELEFGREGSWQNTMAYGRDVCTFSFRLRPDQL